ncbi:MULTISPECIES: SCO6880 family protein [Actinomycetes]|jgi:hypothetical protein|uniref:SCO6880 family protein n=1 Tax=Actinomycetes TaxID=1760 RepID=UPI0004C0E8B6
MVSVLRRSGRLVRTSARLPQVSTPLSIADYRSAGGHTFALVHAEQTAHYTVLLNCEGSLAQWADLFGHRAISMGPDAPDVVGLSAVCESAPASVDGRRQWLLADGHHYLDPDTDIAVRAHVSVTFAAVADDTRKEPEEMGVEVGARLPALIGSLLGTGLAVTPMGSGDVLDVVCAAYNEITDTDGVSWPEIGPVQSHRVRTLLCHDDFVSSSWLISPHVLDTEVLHSLIAPAALVPRKRVTVTYRSTRLSPEIDPDDPSALLHAPHLERFGGIITATEPFGRTPTIEPVTDGLPLFGRLGLRKGYDRHAELFAAGMGIGVLLPEHSDITDEPTRHRHRRAAD